MNDFRKIKYKSSTGYRKLRPLDTVQWHTQAKAFIKNELDNCQHEIPILVSHHLTSPIQVEPEYQDSDYSPAYASDMHTFFNQCKTKPILAINGHSHFCNFTLDNQIYYFSNTYGYHNIDEKPEFDSQAKIVINGTNVDLVKKSTPILNLAISK
ncbi:hypothetical protein N7931_19350, partial [Catenovulum sp. 2E275]|uniref:hypothetical protein n=1 Tax=Catenovulum sp. 2E275 TaxID=2980497 RepID=UPI0021D35458